MTTDTPASTGLHQPDIKQVPIDGPTREAVRRLADELDSQLDRSHPLARPDLERHASVILARLSLPERFLGFAMVAVSNVFWRRQLEAVPFGRRLLLLPNCLRNVKACRGTFNALGLECAGCGACTIDGLKRRAEDLGYQFLIAEGTPGVIMRIMEGQADAIVGVACLDSLEKAFRHVAELGIPNVAVPLLTNGCANTRAETDLIMQLLVMAREPETRHTETYVPLLREAARIFEPAVLDEILAPYLSPEAATAGETEAIALEWLRMGGKRLRPFLTLAAYAVARHGAAALSADADAAGMIPPSIRKAALAIEVLHKASLVHDDIEDDDAFRYGAQTLHRTYGVAPAVNVGDFLVGLGYRLIAGESRELGAERVADVLGHVASAHLELCRGQGAELLWPRRGQAVRPIDALAIYALKTAPAFETALYAGFRAADAAIDLAALKRFCTLLGEGYQVLNDLEDWQEHDANKLTLGQDALSERPTILRAFAIEAGAGGRLAAVAASARRDGSTRLAADVQALYRELGVFDKAQALLDKLRARADDSAGQIRNHDMAKLLRFLVKIVL